MKRQTEARRYVALDVHKHYVMVGAQDEAGAWVLRPRKIRMRTLEKWMPVHLQPTDEVVLESTSNAWTLYDALAPLVARVVVANPLKVRQIPAGPAYRAPVRRYRVRGCDSGWIRWPGDRAGRCRNW